MDVQSRLDTLLGLADSLGISIRRESLGGEGGGLCRLKGQRVLFVDTAADLDTRYERTLRALCDLPEWEGCYVRPELRDDLERTLKSR